MRANSSSSRDSLEEKTRFVSFQFHGLSPNNLCLAGSKWSRKKRPSSKNKCKTPTPKSKSEQLQYPWVREVKVDVQVYAAPILDMAHEVSPRQDAPHQDFVHLHCEVDFDPEQHYAQVLTEARSHLKTTKTSNGVRTSSPQPHVTLPQHHIDAYRELRSKLGRPHKSSNSKLWRYVLFWQKPSNLSRQQAEAELESIFSSPPRLTLNTSRNGICREGKARSSNSMPKPARKGTSGPLNHDSRRSTRTNSSGPLYTDGLPVGPFHSKQSKRSYSGPLGPMGYSNLDSQLSPYKPLHRPPSSSPLYSS